jgi:parallel beta helix pectate lyase-like protein
MFGVRNWIRLVLVIPLLVSALSLATPVQASEVDPLAAVMWCPASVNPPTPDLGGCTAAFSRLTDLLDALENRDPSGAGTFWVGKAYDSDLIGDGDILVPGTVLVNMSMSPQLFNFGWNGLGTGSMDESDPSMLRAAFEIIDWQAGIKVSNLWMYPGLIPSTASVCRPRTFLCVRTTGEISLYRVVEERFGAGPYVGAYLNNESSVSSPPAGVTVFNSRFNRNGEWGLRIYSHGMVSIRDLEAVNNWRNGAYVSTWGNVSFKGVNNFMDNGWNALDVYALDVSASELNADNNGWGPSIQASKNVNIDRGEFKGNRGEGLWIYSWTGSITAKNLTAINNTGVGLDLRSTAPVTTEAVHLSNVNVDSNGDGIRVRANGGITLGCADIHHNISSGLIVWDYAATGDAASLNLPGSASYANGLPDDIHTTTPPVWTPMVCP